MRDADRAADSAPNPSRDIDGEIRALLAQADEKRAQAAAIDLAAATEETLVRTAAAATRAMQIGSDAAEVASAKIHEQQDRFKTGVVASGGSLDDEVPGYTRASRTATGKEDGPGASNRYALMMDRRKVLQDKERMS